MNRLDYELMPHDDLITFAEDQDERIQKLEAYKVKLFNSLHDVMMVFDKKVPVTFSEEARFYQHARDLIKELEEK